MTVLGAYSWDDGILRVSAPHLAEGAEGAPSASFESPRDFAAARFACEEAPRTMELQDGRDMLAAAFGVVPFAKGPLPVPAFGPGVTPAARKAFALFASPEGPAVEVLRAETDDFVVCARRRGRDWDVGAFAVESGSLTVRLEDVWTATPPGLRARSYRADVTRDPHGDERDCTCGFVCETIRHAAPDARIFLDHARGGGFFIRLFPENGA